MTSIRARKEEELTSIHPEKGRNNKSFRRVSNNIAQVVDKIGRSIFKGYRVKVITSGKFRETEGTVTNIKKVGNVHTCKLSV